MDHLVDLREQSDRMIELLSDELRNCRSKSRRQAIADEIEEFKQLRGRLVSVVGEPKRRVT